MKLAVRALTAFFVAGSAVACAVGTEGVTRMADGVRYEGRFVNPEAYAAYLLGVEREAHGDYGGALSAYQEARAEDPDSPEIWARIGAVRCFSKPAASGVAAARSAFERGIQQDPEYFGNYLERARCAERAQDFASALADASHAVTRRPSDESSNLLVARLLAKLGHHAEARTWLEGFQTFHGTSTALSQALSVARHAPPPTAHTLPAGAASSAFEALHTGHPELAQKLAQTELAADPSNSDAWIATLVACDALRDDACFEAALSNLQLPNLAPSPTALGYLKDLLARRAGAPVTF